MWFGPPDMELLMLGMPLLAGRLLTILICATVTEERGKEKLI
jgi:hypothetical protein